MSHAQLFLEWEPPLCIARGYADLGYEEFALMPDGSMISLTNGKVSVLPDEHRRLFFCVPSVQEMVRKIDLAGYDIIEVRYENQRSWVIGVVNPAIGIQCVRRHEQLECALADVLLDISHSKSQQ